MKLFKKIILVTIFLQILLYCEETTVYFSPSNRIDQIIIKKLKEAKKSVYIASYTFNWRQGYNVLRELGEKGVEIKILLNFLPENFCSAKNLYVKKWNGKPGALHAKFIVIDEKYVFTGSANFTESSMIWDSNNMLFIKDEKIGNFFSKNFLSLWSNLAISEEKFLKNQIIEIYFSPAFDCTTKIKNEINKAIKSLKFAMFCFTSDTIGEQICRAGLRGVRVYGIFEGSQNPFSDEYNVMKKIHFLNIKKDCFVKNIHDKFLIVDDRTVLTGSFNYTETAKKNIETLIILRDPEIVSNFIRRWRYLWLWY